MNDRRNQRVVAATLVAATVLLLVSDVLFDVVRSGHGALMTDAHTYVTQGASKATALRYAAISDMFGDYLLLIPAALYLWRALPRDTNTLLLDIATLGGVGFALAGGTAAAVLGFVGSSLMRAYSHAAAADRHAIALMFSAVTDAVNTASWQTVSAMLFPTWMLGLAWELRTRFRAFAWYSAALAVAGLLGAAGSIAGVKYTGTEPDTLIFLPINIWLAWLALLFWRGSFTAE